MSRKRKRGQERKPRDEYIYATTAGPISEIVVTVDQRTGALSFGQEMTNVYSERSYGRAKGPKVVSRIPQGQPELSFDETPALMANFDRLCAIDTNTRVIHGQTISMTGVTTIHPEVIPGPKGLEETWRFDVPFCLEYLDLKVPPENFGWLAAILQLRQIGFLRPAHRIGVVVDSDLGNLRAYNERTKPVLNEQFLMSNVTLIYASADTGKENMINQALGIADTAASQCLKGLETGIIPMITRIEPNAFYDGHRVIDVNAKEGPLGISMS
ncbi:hypothetical protein [Brevundimonas sp. GCM10030266]|uniref:hypothetical protein n=1 Tax=Brevundimonas sp. GCM10030266 TaxID=3273386 RepID=UPI00360E50C0